jgi:hypothetical protein
MGRVLSTLESLLEADEITAGLYVRAHGENLILAREVDEADSGEPILEDRVKLTRLSSTRWGLSVRRHTGRWERTPFTGTMDEIVDTMCSFMQHLVAPY